MEKLKFKKLSINATAPTKDDSNDAGFDLYASSPCLIFSGDRGSVRTSIALEIPDGHVGLIWPRSGLAVHSGIDVLAGVIDSGYRGEIIVCLLNTSGLDLRFEHGSKVAQILIQEIPKFELVEVEELSDSDRGEKGFGSSG